MEMRYQGASTIILSLSEVQEWAGCSLFHCHDFPCEVL